MIFRSAGFSTSPVGPGPEEREPCGAALSGGLRRGPTAAVEQDQAAEGHERQRRRLGDHRDPRLLFDRRVPAPADERPAVGRNGRGVLQHGVPDGVPGPDTQ